MEVDINVYNLINILLQVILWYLIFTMPLTLLTIQLYLYGKYKKWEDSEVKEKEKILLGKANQIQKADEELQFQNEQSHKLNLEIDLLKIRKESLEKELGVTEEKKDQRPADEMDLSSMGVKQLKDLAKQRGLRMYSKKNKQQLIKMLQE